MCRKGFAAVMDGDTPRRNVVVDFLFALLPAILPEPALISGDGQGWPKLQDTILAFGDLNLCAGLIQMQSTPDLGRQRHDTSCLDRHETMKRHTTIMRARPLAVKPQYCMTE